MNRNFGFIGFIVAAGSLFRAVSSDPPPPQKPSTPPQIALAQSACGPSAPEENPFAAVRRVFGSAASNANPSCSSEDCVPPDSARFLMVSLADPEQTHLSLKFDRELESVMWAIEDSGYAFETYWLPWATPSGKALTTFADRECIKSQKEKRHKQPGLLIFRKIAQPPPAEYLFVWLLGETPTSGIDPEMFSNALAYSRALDPHLLHFRLVGPNFSGSLAPLQRQIENVNLKIPGAFFQIVSGSATNLRAIVDFKNVVGPKNLGLLESSVENDQHAFSLFVNYVHTQLSCPFFSLFGFDETAVLSEDETVYGDLGRNWPPSQNSHHRWMMLRYPREIARLRNAAPEPSPSASPDPHAASPESIPFNIRDPSGDEESHPDSVGTFSALQSPVSQQATLLAIASTLRRERAAYTGIIATDVLDSVFLALFLRTSNPDTRLFTIDADLLFLREAESQPLFGMLAVTTYPLFSRNQHWTLDELELDHMPRRVQFASRYAEGTYNACRRLIVSRVPTGPNSPAPDSYLEYERPGDKSREVPPLWLTVVGRDGYWPVALLDEASDIGGAESTITNFSGPGIPHPSKAGNEKFHPEEPSRGWRLLFAVSCLFCFSHVFYMFSILNWTGAPDGEGNGRFYPRHLMNGLHHIFTVYPNDHRPTDQERPFLLTATLSLFSSLLLFSFPLFPFTSYLRYKLYFSVAAICLALLLCIAIQLMRGKREYTRVIAEAWLLSIPFSAVWIHLNLRPDYHSGEFFAYRALYLGNAVSPGIPIVLLAVAFYGWAWMHLHRESEVRNRRVVRHDNDCLADWPWPEKITKPIVAIDDSIEDILTPNIWMPALAFLGFWFVVLFPPESLRSFEFYIYDFLYWTILSAVYWTVSLVLVQFLRCWRQLRKLLQALEGHPIRHAFSRLDKEISWTPLVSAFPARSLVVSVRSFDCLRAIQAEHHALGVHDAIIMENLEKIKPLEENLQSKISESKDITDSYKQVQKILDVVAKHILELCAAKWDNGHSESITNELRRLQQLVLFEDREKLSFLQEEFIALRLLVFIRYVLRHLRNFLGYIIAAFIISMISMNSYSFQAHRWIGIASLITFLAIGTGVALVFAEMDRDAILSRLSDTKANELGPTFFLRLARFGALPLLTVLSGQFPSINRVLFFWIKPAFEAFK